MSESFQKRLFGEEPIKLTKNKNYEPLTDTEKLIYNVLLRKWKPVSTEELHNNIRLREIKSTTFNRALRKLNEKGRVNRIPKNKRLPDPKWEAIR